ncbi:formate dehydrogenase subunit delta [Alcaligenaceae bacterium]|nr:formate dehydrogenase subunit delta [Alcaligenaceae bacterium]
MKNIAHLIRQANRIGAFFEAMPNRNEGMQDIADHIQKFWEPRMRTALLKFIECHPTGRVDEMHLSQIVLDAVMQHKTSLQPQAHLN